MTNFSINLSKIAYPKIKSFVSVGNSLGNYTLKDAKTVSLSSVVGSNDAYACTMLAVNNGKNKFLAHIAPELQPIQCIQKGLEKKLSELCEVSNDVKAVITGAWDSQNADSFELPLAIADLLDKFGIKFSMFCGKKRNSAPENIVMHKNTATIWSDKFKELFAGIKSDNVDNRTIEKALEEHYEIVELSDDIPIKVIDEISQYILNKFTNTSKNLY